jgi:cellulose biosynthesis protein BcsQ
MLKKKALESVKDDYTYSLLIVSSLDATYPWNALNAADVVIILFSEYFALEGLGNY